ncbi:hypothetical protein CEP52_009171, partial [Fusarium oligoseptatum]
MSDYYYSENYQFYNVDDDGGSGGNPSDASKGLSHDVVYNNSAAYDGAAYAGAASKGLSHGVISNNSAAYT